MWNPFKRKGTDEQAVLVYLKLPSGEVASDEEFQTFSQFEDVLAEKISAAGAGEFDGNEIGGGYWTLFMYGPSADRLFDTISADLLARSSVPGSYAVKRYGKPGATETRIPL